VTSENDGVCNRKRQSGRRNVGEEEERETVQYENKYHLHSYFYITIRRSAAWRATWQQAQKMAQRGVTATAICGNLEINVRLSSSVS
jgi:hypothetical protein